jgi:hypothetical protein
MAGQPTTLAATQRMRTEPSALATLSTTVQTNPQHAVLLCRPAAGAGATAADTFRTTLVHYLQEKQAAAIIRVGHNAILYLFPPSDFTQGLVTVHTGARAVQTTQSLNCLGVRGTTAGGAGAGGERLGRAHAGASAHLTVCRRRPSRALYCTHRESVRTRGMPTCARKLAARTSWREGAQGCIEHLATDATRHKDLIDHTASPHHGPDRTGQRACCGAAKTMLATLGGKIKKNLRCRGSNPGLPRDRR